MSGGIYKKVKTFHDLLVWQRGIELVEAVYALELPPSEKYGLQSQMRRSAISIPANIAEGWRRMYIDEVRRFSRIAYGSGGELETYIVLLKRLDLVEEVACDRIDSLLNEVMRMLNSFIRKL